MFAVVDTLYDAVYTIRDGYYVIGALTDRSLYPTREAAEDALAELLWRRGEPFRLRGERVPNFKIEVVQIQ